MSLISDLLVKRGVNRTTRVPLGNSPVLRLNICADDETNLPNPNCSFSFCIILLQKMHFEVITTFSYGLIVTLI